MAADKFLKQIDLEPTAFVCNAVGKLEPVVVESVTALVNNNNGTYTYTNEDAIDVIITIPKMNDLACLNTTNYPTSIPADPSSYVTLPNLIPDGYSVDVYFSSGFIKWVYNLSAGTWSSCGFDLLQGGTLTPAK